MDEQKKYDVIKKLVDTGGDKNRAALTLGITCRQVDRLAKAYRERSKEAFVHGNRGRRTARTIPEKTRTDIVGLYTMKYPDSNFTHFTELLSRNDRITVSVSAAASILEEAGILSPRVTKAKKKRFRQRLEKEKAAAKTKKKSSGYRKTLSPWKMPIPDVPGAPISGSWNKWTLPPIYSLETIRQCYTSPWVTPPA